MSDTGDRSLEQEAEELFQLAADLPSGERDRFVAARARSPAVRARVEALLAAIGSHDAAKTSRSPSLDSPVWADTRDESDELDIGPGFRFLRLVGEGGFGSVYLAEQVEPVRRRVAIKVIKSGMDTRQVIARFRGERQALAMMDHPGIARVFEAGATAHGRPYFVMEYIEGRPLLRFCDEMRLDIQGRLELHVRLCRAIEHAHQKGVIHRDLKPSNVLVVDAEPGSVDGGGQPKVIDFGIAKAMDHRLGDGTAMTEAGGLIGTPMYMSPEQARGASDIDTRTDIYALGVLLYEMLCGGLPSKAEPERPSTRVRSLGEQIQTVSHSRRTEPQRLRRALRGDLDWIVMKAIEGDRNRRYATAGALADDILRHLTHQPVLAGPPDRWYRFTKVVRRNRGVVAAVSAVFLAIILGLGASIAGLVEARRERDNADRARARAVRAGEEEARQRSIAEEMARVTSRQLYAAELSAAAAGYGQRNAAAVWQSLALAPAALRGWEWRHLAYAAWPGQIEYRLPPGVVRPWCQPIPGTTWALLVYSGDEPGAVIWDTHDGAAVRSLACRSAAMSLDGTLLVLAEMGGGLAAFEVASGDRRWRVESAASGPWSVSWGAFSIDGRHVLAWAGEPNRCHVLSAEDGSIIRTDVTPMPIQEAPEFVDLQDGRPSSVVFIRSGAIGQPQSRPVIYDLDSQRQPETAVHAWLLPDRRGTADLRAVLYHASGRHYAAPSVDLDADVRSVAVDARGNRVAIGDARGATSLWDWPASSSELSSIGSLLASEDAIQRQCFSNDERSLLITSAKSVRIAPAVPSPEPQRTGPSPWDDASRFSPDGRWISRAQWGMIGVFDTEFGLPRWRRNLGRGWHRLQAWSPDGGMIAVASHTPEEFFVVDAHDGRVLLTCAASAVVPDPSRPAAPPEWLVEGVTDLAFSPDGRSLLVARGNGAVTMVDPRTGQERDAPRVAAVGAGAGVPATVRHAPDGHALVHLMPEPAHPGRAVAVLRDPSSLDMLRRIDVAFEPSATGWSADSTRLAVGGASGAVSVVSIDTGGTVWASPPVGSGSVVDLAWSPDGSRLAACLSTGDGVVLDATDGARLFTLPIKGGNASAAWLDGGATLASASSYGQFFRFESHRSDDEAWVRLAELWPSSVPAPADLLRARSTARDASMLVDAAILKQAPTSERLAMIESAPEPAEVRLLAAEWLRRLGPNINYSNSSCIMVGRDDGASLADRRGAVGLLKEVAALKPQAAQLVANLAWAQYRAGDPAGAEESVQRYERMTGVSGRSASPQVRVIRALCERALGRDTGAKAECLLAFEAFRSAGEEDDPDVAAMHREFQRVFGPEPDGRRSIDATESR